MKYDYRKNIYTIYLAKISNITFTPREIDIISCILHNRGDKKIAILLDISYRTVGSHTRNIMQKINCNIRDQIIDFIEKSNKSQYIRKYYIYIVMENSLNNRLAIIGNKFSLNKIHIDNIENTKSKDVLEHIAKDLSLANIKLIGEDKEQSKNILVINKSSDIKNIQHIGIILDDEVQINETEIDAETKYIDFRKDYHIGIFKLIEYITNKEIDIKEFLDHYNNLKEILKGNEGNIVGTEIIEFEQKKYRVIIIAILLFLFLIFAGYYIVQKQNKEITNPIVKSLISLKNDKILDKTKYFVGRKNILKQLYEKITTKNSKTNIIILTGIQGIGKTTTAEKFADDLTNQDKDWIAVKFNASTEEELFKNYILFALKINIISEVKRDILLFNTQKLNKEQLEDLRETEIKDIIIQLQTHLASINKRLLLIFDNIEVNDFQEKKKEKEDYFYNKIRSYFPTKENIKILITSRNGLLNNIRLVADETKLEYGLDKDEILEYFRNKIKHRKDIAEQDLIDFIDEITIKTTTDKKNNKISISPYFMERAAAFLINPKNDFETLLDFINKYKSGEYDREITKTLIKNLAKDKQNKPIHLLQYLSYLQPDFIDITIIEKLIGKEYKEIINHLRRLSFIDSVNHNNKTGVKIHRLTQGYIQRFTTIDNNQDLKFLTKTQIFADLTKIFNSLVTKQDLRQNNFHNLKPYINDMEFILNKINNDQEYKKLLHNEEFIKQNKDFIQNFTRLFIKYSKYLIKLRNHFMITIKHIDQILDIQKILHKDNPNHPDIADTYHSLGNIYYFKGEYYKAIKYYKKALKIRKIIHKDNPNHPDIADTYHILGFYYCSQNQYDPEAIKYLNKALEIRKIIHKDNLNHPDIADTYHSLGFYYAMRQGNINKSIKYLKKSLEIKKIAYKDNLNNYSFLTHYFVLGYLYYLKEDDNKAMKYYNRGNEICETLKVDVPHIKYSKNLLPTQNYHNLGYIFEGKLEYDKAIKYHKKALKVSKIIYKDNAPDTAFAYSYNALGNVYNKKREYDKALKYLKKALKCYNKSQISQFDYYIATNYTNLGKAYNGKKEYDKAIKHFKKALEIWKICNETGHNNYFVAVIYIDLGDSYYFKGEYSTAIKFYRKSLDIRYKIYSQDKDYTIFNHLQKTYNKLIDILHKIEEENNLPKSDFQYMKNESNIEFLMKKLNYYHLPDREVVPNDRTG